jgi:beta-barrel assembly-enhancing protease
VAYQHIRRIRDTILQSGLVEHRFDFSWDVKIINDTTLNAFCTPGGHIYFYKGLIKYLDNEAEFAGVMAHEMAHAALRHTTDQLTRTYGITTLLSIIFGKDPGLLAQVGAYLLTLKFSRTNENQADEYSVIYLYATSYDARGTAGFFEKLDQGQQGGMNVPFLSTHPSDASRIQRINDKWQSLGGKVGQTYDSRYQSFKSSIP